MAQNALAHQARPRVRGHGYPRDRLEIIIVDSANTDGTAERARRRARTHPDLDVRMVEEPERRGKAIALNTALAMARGEVFVITDADCSWPQNAATASGPPG